MGSLYEKLGGEAAVDTVVEDFYRNVLTDDRIAHFFDDTDMELQAAKQKSFLMMVFGGPTRYTGKDMRTAHQHLVKQGLQDEHVDCVIELLGRTLVKYGVTQKDIDEVVKIANSVRDEVLNR